MKTEPRLILSRHDYNTLNSLAARGDTENTQVLEEELSRADVLPDESIPADVVSIHSKVSVTDLESGTDSVITLVYPHEADVESHKVSILAPMSLALLGLRAGQSYEWKTPQGRQRKFRITGVEKHLAA